MLEEGNSTERKKIAEIPTASSQSLVPDMTQLSIFDAMGGTQTDDILFELRDIDLSHVTPMDAMNLVYKWQNQLKERW